MHALVERGGLVRFIFHPRPGMARFTYLHLFLRASMADRLIFEIP